MVDFLLSTGIRVGELVRLNIDDIDFSERECVVYGKGDKAMMEKIEKDIEISKTEKKIIKYAWIAILVGAILLVLGNIFEGNPIIEFLSGATPWVLLGLTFLCWIMSLNKQNTK